MKASNKCLLAAAAAALFLGSFDKVEALYSASLHLNTADDSALMQKWIFKPVNRMTEEQKKLLKEAQKGRDITEGECAYLRGMYTGERSDFARLGMLMALQGTRLQVNPYAETSTLSEDDMITMCVIDVLQHDSKNMKLPLDLGTWQKLYQFTRDTKGDYDLEMDPENSERLVAEERKGSAQTYLENFFWDDKEVLTEEKKRDIEDLIAGKGEYDPKALAAKEAREIVEKQIHHFRSKEIDAIRKALDERERQLRGEH